MYSVATGWYLHDIPKEFQEEASEITLRGYDAEKVGLTGEYSWDKPISVDEIANDICPVKKDLYNYRARKHLSKSERAGKRTWGRIAGLVVEPFCTGLLGKFDNLYSRQDRVNYETLTQEIEIYSQNFFDDSEVKNHIENLKKTQDEDDYRSPEFLRLVLQYSARNELSSLGVDYLLEAPSDNRLPLMKRFPISLKREINPKSSIIGISEKAAPDFMIENIAAVGDVKSGLNFKTSHQMTCTGYALARESELGPDGDTNFGIIYFIETQNILPTPARSYFFVINDKLRRAFLDRRDLAYAVLSNNQMPDIRGVIRKNSCIHCKYLELCDKDREANGIPID